MDKVRVLLADDEPFILKGIQMLIDWEQFGCEIAGTAGDGQKAYEIIKEGGIDIAIVDIRMPKMTGLELIAKVREEGITDTQFIILSGYSDFEYAQSAIRLNVLDYLLKPVSRPQLINALRNRGVRRQDTAAIVSDESDKLKRACLVQYLIAIMSGKSNDHQLKYVSDNLVLKDNMNFVHISLDNVMSIEELADEEVMAIKNRVLSNCSEFLGHFADHLLPEAEGFEEDYELGFIYCDIMAKEQGIDDRTFLENLRKAAMKDVPMDIVMLVGSSVSDIVKLESSYRNACSLRYFKAFRKDNNICYYDDDLSVPHTRAKQMVHKKAMDALVDAVIKHDSEEIEACVDELFDNMENIQHNDKLVYMNVNYFLFRMINLAVEIDETVEQDNILIYITDDVFVPGKNFKEQLKNFAIEYSDYLVQLKENTGHGGLKTVERYIQEHYSENLTLRDLGKKYFVNSSYLGQLFRKKYGMSFKDYLNSCRINAAAEMLLKSDRKVADIAAEVGYKDIDYFVAKFIEINGCTPTKFRRSV